MSKGFPLPGSRSWESEGRDSRWYHEANVHRIWHKRSHLDSHRHIFPWSTSNSSNKIFVRWEGWLLYRLQKTHQVFIFSQLCQIWASKLVNQILILKKWISYDHYKLNIELKRFSLTQPSFFHYNWRKSKSNADFQFYSPVLFSRIVHVTYLCYFF